MTKVNWDFGDYNSLKYPLDLNSIPWYPATFPAPIPKFLIGLLSEPEDIIFDPFGGKGTTAVEALKQRRRFIYNDLNPHAVSIMRCLLEALNQKDEEFALNIVECDRSAFALRDLSANDLIYKGKDEKEIYSKLPRNFRDELVNRNIKPEVVYWFHADTMQELLRLYDYIRNFQGVEKGIRKLAFLSILKEVSSQRGHFSYVTDNCRPLEMKYYNAINAYLDMLDRLQRAYLDFLRQYSLLNKTDDLKLISEKSLIHSGDAKDCSYIADNSIDLIITSPPYLCAQDYILTMRLNDFFFPELGFTDLPFKEIGPRRLRTRSGIADSYFADMDIVLKELYRVLKRDAYFCLIIGEGQGKVSKGINVVEKVMKSAADIGFKEICKNTRNISYKINRNGGVNKEELILYKK
jgi:DNA modification methylase